MSDEPNGHAVLCAAKPVAWRMWEPEDGGWWRTTSSEPEAQYYKDAGFTVEPLYAVIATPSQAIEE